MSKFIRSNNLDISDEVVSSAFNLLVEYGFALEKEFGDCITRYEHLHPGEHHDHFYCLKCGKIIEFYSPVIEELKLRKPEAEDSMLFPTKCRFMVSVTVVSGKPQKSL